MTTLGLALIARDEEEFLPGLLESIDGAFDRVVLLDTGSTDGTVRVFQEWARGQVGMTYAVAWFAWCEDFAAARTASVEMLDTDWCCWADCDDRITGARNLRRVLAAASADTAGYTAGYDYARDHRGNSTAYHERLRLWRPGAAAWRGRVHELLEFDAGFGAREQLPADTVEWVHRRPDAITRSNARNLRILEKWAADEPDDARMREAYGTELALAGEHRRAVAEFEAGLSVVTPGDETRLAALLDGLASSLLRLGRIEDAMATAQQLLATCPEERRSGALTIARGCLLFGQNAEAVEWARRVRDYEAGADRHTRRARAVLAVALAELGHEAKALQEVEAALAPDPADKCAAQLAAWRADIRRRREHASRTRSGARPESFSSPL